jgi:hypothetical protein
MEHNIKIIEIYKWLWYELYQLDIDLYKFKIEESEPNIYKTFLRIQQWIDENLYPQTQGSTNKFDYDNLFEALNEHGHEDEFIEALIMRYVQLADEEIVREDIVAIKDKILWLSRNDVTYHPKSVVPNIY